jgi:carboxymethylenebutenolidase
VLAANLLVNPPAKQPENDPIRLGIIGFCRGGHTVWEYAAHNGALKAGVSFCGPPVDPPNPIWPKRPTQLAPEMKALVLGLCGAEFKIYPGAPHGFHADYRASYRKEAADDGWNQMQAWFKKYNLLG